MEAEPKLIHDATTGFHDIKAIPGFRPSTDELLWPWYLLLGVSFLALLFFLLRVFFARKKKNQVPELPARDVFRIELGRMNSERASGSLDTRGYSSRLSFAIRRYLEKSFFFPATDLTPGEIKSSFPAPLGLKAPHLTPLEKQELIDRVLRAVQSLDRISFGTVEIQSIEAGALPELVREAESLVLEFEQVLAGVPEQPESFPKPPRTKAHAL